jgi:hypothetical protein
MKAEIEELQDEITELELMAETPVWDGGDHTFCSECGRRLIVHCGADAGLNAVTRRVCPACLETSDECRCLAVDLAIPKEANR